MFLIHLEVCIDFEWHVRQTMQHEVRNVSLNAYETTHKFVGERGEC